jgi:hypothetical protein
LVLVRPVYAEASPSFLAGGRPRRRAAPGSPTPLDAAWCSSRASESRNPAGGRGRRVRGFAGGVCVLSIGTLRSSHPPEAASWWVASTGSSRRLYASSGTRERDLACVAGRATGGWSRSPLVYVTSPVEDPALDEARGRARGHRRVEEGRDPHDNRRDDEEVAAPPVARVIKKMKKTAAAIRLRVPRVSQRVSEFSPVPGASAGSPRLGGHHIK